VEIDRSAQASSERGPSVKGVAFRTVVTVLAKARSQAVVDASLARMPAEAGDALRYGTIITAGWYPVEWYRALWSAICGATGEGEELVRALGRASIDHDVNTLYRALFRLLSPRTLVAMGLKHFSRIYDTGSVAVTDEPDGSLRVRWSGCTGFDRNMWVEILGSCERLGELAGAKSPRGTIQEGGEGASCIALFTARHTFF
jgi:hypothetical protein